MRRLIAAGVGVLVAVVTTVLLGTPARAGAFDGDVTNLIPSSSGLTVHIACFGKDCPTNTTCKVHNLPDNTCRRWWLPAGWADDGLQGQNFDTDGFTVAERSFQIRSGLWWINVPAGTFYKIGDGSNATCEYIGGRAICRVY